MPRNRRSTTVNVGRHASECRICAHRQCYEIEQDFIAWRSPASITKQYGLQNRSTVYRHAHALNLFSTRQRNVRAALEKIIERAGEVDVTASAVVAAVQAYSKINTAGQWVEFQDQHCRSMGRPERTCRPECSLRKDDGTGVGSLRTRRLVACMVSEHGGRNS
jgi:hypothetical protein